MVYLCWSVILLSRCDLIYRHVYLDIWNRNSTKKIIKWKVNICFSKLYLRMCTCAPYSHVPGCFGLVQKNSIITLSKYNLFSHHRVYAHFVLDINLSLFEVCNILMYRTYFAVCKILMYRTYFAVCKILMYPTYFVVCNILMYRTYFVVCKILMYRTYFVVCNILMYRTYFVVCKILMYRTYFVVCKILMYRTYFVVDGCGNVNSMKECVSILSTGTDWAWCFLQCDQPPMAVWEQQLVSIPEINSLNHFR